MARTVGAAAAAAVVAVAALAAAAAAQGVPSCASKLVGCAQYLNATGTPPAATCCGPLREAAVNETACLCAVLSDKAVLRAFNVDPAQGLLLAKRCNVSADPTTCSKASAAGTPASSNGTTASPASQNNGAVRSASWAGAFSLATLLSIIMA